jgi:hypothetical protein
VREKEVEAALVKAVKKRNGMALKFVSPGLDGVPDRIVLLPNGKLAFIELKRPGGRMRKLQEKRKAQLESLGFLVYCVNDKDEIGGILDGIQAS